jgi:pimeloyl-ACP methyl ester carboxylesterase
MASPRIIFFPGLGCDHRLVEPNRGIRLPIDVPKWIRPRDRDEPLADYARRMAETLEPRGPIYLAGVSLGAMIAQEIARYLPTRGVIILAGCRSWRGIPRSHWLVAEAAGRAPAIFAAPTRRVMPRVRILFGIKRREQVGLFESMLGEADLHLLRWSLLAPQNWPGVGPLDVPTLQVHGTIDHVLPRELAGPVDHQVVGAGHVMNVTHAAEVNATVNAWLARQGEG